MRIAKSMFRVGDCVASYSTRYAINSVSLERQGDKIALMATDGRRLLVARWNDETPEEDRAADFKTLLPIDGWKLAEKSIRRADGSVTVDEHGANGTVQLTSSETGQSTVLVSTEGRFPNYQDIIPSYDESDCVEIGFDPKLLGDILRTIARMKKGDSDKSRGVKLTIPHNTGRPIRIDAKTDDGTEIVGVVMPYNLDKVNV